jgi:hypothetical protein
MSKGGFAALSLNEKVMSAERGAVSISGIRFNSVLSPRYSVLISVFPSTFEIHYSLFQIFFVD